MVANKFRFVLVSLAVSLALSGAEVVAAAAASDPPGSRAIDSRDLPPLPGVPSRPEPVAPADPGADFAPLAGQGGRHFEPGKSRAVSRSMFLTEYSNPDGTRTVRQSAQPQNVQDSVGVWHAVDTTLAADSATGRARAKHHPLNPSLGQRGNDTELVSVEVDGKRAWLSPEQASAATGRVSGSQMGYPDVRPGVDLDYEVTAGAVKEIIRLKRPPGAASWRFRLGTNGLTPAITADGAVRFTDDAGTVPIVMPPIETWDSSGGADHPPATTGGSYRLEKAVGGWVLTIAVDEGWLRDPKRVYPVNVDPTFQFGDDISFSYKSDGATCQNCGLKVGSPLHNGTVWRSIFHVDYSSLWGRTVVGARMDVTNQRNATTVDKTYPANLYHATAFNFNGVGEHLAGALVGQVGSFADDRLTAYLRTAINNRDVTPYFMIIGSEQPDVWTYKNLAVTLTIDTGTAPPAPIQTGPPDNSVVTTLSPTLSVNPVSDPDGDEVKYCFRVATGADGKSGVVVDSGCLPTPNWTVPTGVLQDGVSYTWQASAYSGTTMVTQPGIGHFRVDQRIGDRGPAPVDTVGPITVNLANGNATTTQSSPSFATVGGTAGVTMTYNTQQKDAKGLRASYFPDLSRRGDIPDAQQPVLVRTEPQVNVDFNAASPFPPALEPDWFVVRWEGFFQPPVTGTYQFAGVHDDTLRIWVNNQQVYNVGCCSDVNWSQAGGIALTAGDRVPIKVELVEATGLAYLRLFTRTTDETTVPAQIVPASWLFSTDSPALPTGWTLSADLDGTGGGYTDAKITDQSILLTDATGAKHSWVKKSSGGYTPPEGEDGVLALDSTGRVTLSEGSEVYVFRADGKLESQSAAVDSRKPAALQNIYDGVPSRLKEIKDPVSGRAHRLFYNRPGDDCYGSMPRPPGFDPLPPQQMLCRIGYWDGTETRLWYLTGKLWRIEDPGSEITEYSYTPNGYLDGTRDSMTNDWIAADPARSTTQTNTAVHYVDHLADKPVVSAVLASEPIAGVQPRPRHVYRYDPANRQTFVDIDGLRPSIGFASKVTYDEAFRLLSTTDATGRTTSQTWSVKDQQLTTTDAAGRVSTTVYDHADRPTDNYGPAPAACFNGQLPTVACANTVPHQHTNYDEGIPGLSVAYYDNTSLTGAPKVYRTGFGATDGQMATGWDETTSPAPGIPAGNFGIRLTGEIQFPATGAYRMELYVDDGSRMWIDDQLVIDSWELGSPRGTFGTFNNTVAGSIHRIRVDYYNGGGPGTLHVKWQRPDGTHEGIPGAYMRPRYGLTTSTVQAESDGVPNQASTIRFGENGLDPVYGLATSTSTGSLVTSAGHEAPGSGYLRKTSKTMPTGAVTTYAHYGDNETRANPCVPGRPAVNQGGLPKLTTSTTPATGPARVDELVYDDSGRVVAKSTSGAWICTTYDSRDRVVAQTYPASATSAGRTVTTDFKVGGDPLTTSVTDPQGTVTTRVDLLGRVVSYTDVHGLRADTVYDQTGRVTTETVTPPNAADPPQVTTFTYDDAGRVLTQKLGGTVLATATYNTAGELATAAYSNGSSLSAIGKDTAGRVTSLTWKTSDNAQIVTAVGRTRAGTVIDETLAGADARPNAPNYVYDTVGRLTEAWVAGHHYTYDFTAPTSSGCPTGIRSNTGQNTNRVRLLDQTSTATTETGYCYDDADRILASTGANAVSNIDYDSHGNTLRYLQGAATTTLTWDGADRNTGVRTTGPDPAVIAYTRDATDRIVRRDATTGDATAAVLYAYTGSGDAADVALGSDKRVATRSISLPGGVLYTVRDSQSTWDHPTVRGDLSLTTDIAGRQSGALRAYNPYGEPISEPDAVPDNQPGHMDYGWLGQHQRPYEHASALSLVQMGARPYSPMLGRFLSVDPVEGGSSNDYEYANGDSINNTDLDGKKSRKKRKPSTANGMNKYERARCDWLPRECAHYMVISKWALIVAARLSPKNIRAQNAMRHFMWQAALTVKFGRISAAAWADAHEGDDRSPDHYSDMRNNAVGRNYGGKIRRGNWSPYGDRIANGAVFALIFGALDLSAG